MRIGIFTLFFHDIGIGPGAYFRGLVIDLTSSYAVLFGSCIVCCVLGLIASLFLLRGKRPDPITERFPPVSSWALPGFPAELKKINT